MFKKSLVLLLLLLSSVTMAKAEEYSWLDSEKIGNFSTGMSGKDIHKQLTCAFKYGKEEVWEADGLYHQSWDCPASGISFEMSSGRKGGNKNVDRISITVPSKLKTKRGIGIGSTEQQVIQVYNDVKDVQGTVSKEVFIAGSVYGGLFFYFKDGKVTSIILGAGAE